jgi:hypothetical protein
MKSRSEESKSTESEEKDGMYKSGDVYESTSDFWSNSIMGSVGNDGPEHDSVFGGNSKVDSTYNPSKGEFNED